MTNFYGVIGSGYGDEGKGRVVDALSFALGPNIKNNKTAVIRFNGSAQAAHTVCAYNDRQVFNSINSGYLNSCPTIFGQKFVVCPRLLSLEIIKIRNKYYPTMGVRIYCDPDCRVITPYDQIYNHWANEKNQHGTCGIGFGASIERDLHVPLTFNQTQNNNTLYKKFDQIKQYYIDNNYREFCEYFESKIKSHYMFSIDMFIDCRSYLASNVIYIRDVKKSIKGFENIIFEGAQGLFLDEDSKDFPHVTRSKTGSEYIREIHDGKLHNFYVTRCFQTRHGNGPLIGEFDKSVFDKTNGYNDFQGKFRGAPLDVDRVVKSIMKDVMKNKVDKSTVVLTHMDTELIDENEKLEVIKKLGYYETIEMSNNGIRCNKDIKNINRAIN